jgi:hypothetical protein
MYTPSGHARRPLFSSSRYAWTWLVPFSGLFEHNGRMNVYISVRRMDEVCSLPSERLLLGPVLTSPSVNFQPIVSRGHDIEQRVMAAYGPHLEYLD